MNVENRGYHNFLLEVILIWNTHPQGLCVSYIIKKFLSFKLAQFINFLLELINFVVFGVWICHNGLMVPKSFIFIRSQIGSHGVFGSLLTYHTFDWWFSGGYIIFGWIFLITLSNLFCSPLWKVKVSFESIFDCSNHSKLLTCTISHFLVKPTPFF